MRNISTNFPAPCSIFSFPWFLCHSPRRWHQRQSCYYLHWASDFVLPSHLRQPPSLSSSNGRFISTQTAFLIPRLSRRKTASFPSSTHSTSWSSFSFWVFLLFQAVSLLEELYPLAICEDPTPQCSFYFYIIHMIWGTPKLNVTSSGFVPLSSLCWPPAISVSSLTRMRPLQEPHPAAIRIWNLFCPQFSHVSHSVASDSLQPHGLQHTRLPCPSTPRACSNSCPLSWWCHPTISSSVIPFSSCLQSFPASGSFPMSQFFTSGGQNIGASALVSVLPMNIQDWFPLGLTGWISLQWKRLSRAFSNTTAQKL